MYKCNSNALIFAFHTYTTSTSDYYYVSYYTYCLIASMLTILLVYSLSISNKNLSTSAFSACSNDVSAIFFDAILSRLIPPTQ